MQISRTASFLLPLPIDQAHRLFTAEGERQWVPGWTPTFIHSDAFETTTKGTVWETQDEGERVLWMCVDWDPPKWTRYVRVTAERFDVVEIECEAVEKGTMITVQYVFTPLSDEGQVKIQAMDAQAFAEKIAAWPDLISKV